MKLGWYNTFGTDSDEVSVRDHLDLIVALVLQPHAPRELERQCLDARAEITVAQVTQLIQAVCFHMTEATSP